MNAPKDSVFCSELFYYPDMMSGSNSIPAYFDTHEKLATWNDDLEFLGYILCEVIKPDEFNRRGFQCHQAIDFPAIVSILREESSQPDGKLKAFMNKNERKVFRKLLDTTRGIRNFVAHHQVPDETHVNKLQLAKEQLCSRIESLISKVASELAISQVGNFPALKDSSQIHLPKKIFFV